MKFLDQAKIYIQSGDGGAGCVSFRREKYIEFGGPNGGDGGKGGDIIFEVDDGLNTLTDFRHVRKYVARDGEQGGKKRCSALKYEMSVSHQGECLTELFVSILLRLDLSQGFTEGFLGQH